MHTHHIKAWPCPSLPTCLARTLHCLSQCLLIYANEQKPCLASVYCLSMPGYAWSYVRRASEAHGNCTQIGHLNSISLTGTPLTTPPQQTGDISQSEKHQEMGHHLLVMYIHTHVSTCTHTHVSMCIHARCDVTDLGKWCGSSDSE